MTGIVDKLLATSHSRMAVEFLQQPLPVRCPELQQRVDQSRLALPCVPGSNCGRHDRHD